MRHCPGVPESCKRGGRGCGGAFTWDRATLQDPVVEALRELVEHPAILEQATVAARHKIPEAVDRLTHEQRAELERQVTQVRQRIQAAAEEWVERAADDPEIGLEEYQHVAAALRRKRDSLERRLAADADAAGSGRQTLVAPNDHEGLKEAFLEILTVETPQDPLMLQLRARLFQCLVSRVEIDDDGDPSKPIVITVEGHLIPGGGPGHQSPLAAAADLLHSYIVTREGEEPEPERKIAELGRLEARDQRRGR